jgi:sporulation protein YlmC with PRC-barrel domain
MLRNTKEIYGYKLIAADGDVGHVQDFYFDDKTWVIRYVVVDTGPWLTGRQVLLSPHAFGRFGEADGKALPVNLTRKRIEGSPSIESHRPVSRQFEIEYYRYYGWPTYWDGGAMWGLGGYPALVPPTKAEREAHQEYHHRADKHLQSAHAVTGYHIQTVDGTIGHVSGMMVDDRSWGIRDLVVETGHWYSGKAVLISPARVERISYEESTVFVNLTKADIQQTAENHLAKAGAGKH